MQQAANEIWSGVPYQSSWPQVQAYKGELPPGSLGIEFFTEIPPDSGSHPVEVRWSGFPFRADVRTEDDVAKIKCEIVRVETRQVPT